MPVKTICLAKHLNKSITVYGELVPQGDFLRGSSHPSTSSGRSGIAPFMLNLSKYDKLSADGGYKQAFTGVIKLMKIDLIVYSRPEAE